MSDKIVRNIVIGVITVVAIFVTKDPRWATMGLLAIVIIG